MLFRSRDVVAVHEALLAFEQVDPRDAKVVELRFFGGLENEEVAQLLAVGGDAAVRAVLLKLAETAPEFSAGFDRVPSLPDAWTNGFETVFFLDLEWRGGRKLVRIRLYASPADGGWRTVGFAADAP